MKRGWLVLWTACLTVLVLAAGAAIYFLGGFYNVAADVPHTQPVYWLMETAREQSIERRSAGIAVPDDLSNAGRILSGAGQYATMCAGCHLAPGVERTELSRGLYPRAPRLARHAPEDPAEAFWVIKHGVKMTGMPAWGVTHDDALLWDIVAFLQQLPTLTPEQYRALVEKAPSHDEVMEEMGGGHGDHGGHSH